MKFEPLTSVIVASSYSPYNGQVGIVLSGNEHFSEVTFFDSREIFFSGEIVPIPKQFKLGDDKFITLCAWHLDRDLTIERKITAAGWRISHTICPDCRARMMPKKIDKVSQA